MAVKKKAKKKKPSIEMTLWGVVLSYPVLDKPRPFKGKSYYSTDLLLDEDHEQLKELRSNIGKVKRMAWGADKSEWPETKAFIQNGDGREDQKAYRGKLYIKVSTQQPVPVVNPKGKDFNPAMVKGGMTANVAINISAWKNDGDEGISIYLQGVQIDTSVAKLDGFGGGRSVKKMFDLDDSDDSDDGDDSDSDTDSDDDEDDDDTPRGKKKPVAKKGKRVHKDDDDDDSDDKAESDDSEE